MVASRSAKRRVLGSEPESALMMVMALIALVANSTCLILISRHRDGELIARTMQRFGHRVVRGSSSRGATAALKALVRELMGR